MWVNSTLHIGMFFSAFWRKCLQFQTVFFEQEIIYAHCCNSSLISCNINNILNQLGISPSSAIQMFYSKIVMSNGIPFELRIPDSKPTAIGSLTREQLDNELMKASCII
jgi:addiction module RelB/DinJ family antitoxin